MANDNYLSAVSDQLNKLSVVATKTAMAFDTLLTTFDRVLNALGQQIAKFVALANPAAVTRFNLAVQNAVSALGRALLPTLEKFTVIIQKLGNAIESLSPQAKQLISVLAVGGGLATVFGAVAIAATLLVNTLGVLPTLIGVAVAAFAGVATTMASGKEIMAAAQGVFKQIGGIFESIAKALMPIVASTAGPIIKALGDALSSLGEAAIHVFSALAPVLKASLQIFGAVVGVLSSIIQVAAPLLEVVLMPLVTTITIIARVISALLVPVLNGLAYVIKEVADFIVGIVNRLRRLIGKDDITFDPNAKNAQAVRQSQMTDLRGIASRSYTQTFGGAGVDVQGSILNENKFQTRLLDAILRAIQGGSQNGRPSTQPGAPSAPGSMQQFVMDRMRRVFGG